MIPHFEKMLYDNGPLLALAAQAARIGAGNEDLFERTARETGGWAIREMQSPDGGFFSALDADSEGEEGRFYLWTPDAARAVLDEDEFGAVAASFGLDRPPNFEGKEWHLHTFVERAGLAAKLGVEEAAAVERLGPGPGPALRCARASGCGPDSTTRSSPPGTRSWSPGSRWPGRPSGRPNSSMRRSGHSTSCARTPGWTAACMPRGRTAGPASPAYLDDHAFLLEAALRLLQARWRPDRLAFAIEIADALLDRFEDRERGGFWFTAHDHEALMPRSKSFSDDSMPAGNGVAAAWLGRLGHLLAESRYLEAAERTLRSGWTGLVEMPHAHGAMLTALEEYLEPPQTVVLRGRGAALERWRERCAAPYAPRRYVVAVPDDAAALPGMLEARAPHPEGEPIAYVCEGHRCDAPVTSFGDLEAALRPLEAGGG